MDAILGNRMANGARETMSPHTFGRVSIDAIANQPWARRSWAAESERSNEALFGFPGVKSALTPTHAHSCALAKTPARKPLAPGSDVRHRLVAILAADAVGYSRMMAVDDVATLSALDAARRIFHTHVDSRNGRVADAAGDSVLAVFDTALGAVSAALAIQALLEPQFEGQVDQNRLLFRIGIHLGDVLEKPDGTVYGDGVNIAARLQALAEPGGVMVSHAVQGTLASAVGAAFEDLGEHVVKNIVQPVHAFRLLRVGSPPEAPCCRLHQKEDFLGPEKGLEWNQPCEVAMRILMVDDHTMFLQGLKNLLGVLAPELHLDTCSELSTAVQLSGLHRFDLVLLDWHLAECDGEESMRRLRDAGCAARIVVLSGETSAALIQSTVELGAAGFIPKTYSSEMMISALDQVIAGRIFLPAEAQPAAGAAGALGLGVELESDPRFSGLTARQTDVYRCAPQNLVC
ncbi:response regulator [Variovorax sp. J22R133]|uniref:response regulator n=1 Tax=Variovorax brevis TaxID=3053503 RepID=UPI002576A553|nr:response regulator [Variovorax sp. J22R133]MDM0117840.1 response regulator [Variovorax sp. J22R133]